MIPGEFLIESGEIELNAGRETVQIKVANTGDRPIQVGSHFHFYEVNTALQFDRTYAKGMRLDIPAGTAVRFEPGDEREVTLVALAGRREVYGFQNLVNGALDGTTPTPEIQPGISIKQALASGCRGKDNLWQKISYALQNSDIGDVTAQKLKDLLDNLSRKDNWSTWRYVTDPNTWGFRSPTIPGEVAVMKQGRLISKAQRRVSKIEDNEKIKQFWESNGPNIVPSHISENIMSWHNALSFSLQILSTSSSDFPPSQFVSVALDESVASAFMKEKPEDYRAVYKFQMNPQSPIFGMRDCSLKGGEVQLQVPGGTPIYNLQRKRSGEAYWEEYKNENWSKVDKDEL